MYTIRLLSLLAGLVLCGQAARAAPDGTDPFERTASPEERPPLARAIAVAIRVQPPVSGIFAASQSTGSQGFEALGAAVALRAFALVELEVSEILTATVCYGGSATVVRAGVVPRVRRPGGRGTNWELRIPILATYFAYSGNTSCADSYAEEPRLDLRGLLLSSGFEATRWGRSGRVGFDLRVLLGIGGGRARDSSAIGQGSAWVDAGAVSELSLSLGVVFQ